MFTSAIVLAAGESKRMGQTKLLLPFGNSTIIEQVVDNVVNSSVSEVIAVIGYQAKQVMRKLAGKPVKIVVNPLFKKGMSTSIKAGVHAINSNAQAIMIVLADQPLIDSSVINELVDFFRKTDKKIVVPSYKGKRGHPVIFSSAYIQDLLKLTGDHGGRRIIEQHADDVLTVSIKSHAISLDIDTLEDYLSLKKISSESKDFSECESV